MSLRPDHDAAALRDLMNRFAEVTTAPTRQELTESLAAVTAAPGVAEGDEMGTFAALKGWQQWNVLIRNNFYNGRYPDYSARLYGVVASSPEEARQVVLNNADYVLKDLLSKKTPNGKRWLPPKSAVPIEDKRVGSTDTVQPGSLTTMGFKTMLTPEGPKSMKFNNGQIVDIQGEESTVAEGLDQARVSPETLQVVQQLRKQLSRRTSLQAKKTMLVIKSDQLGPQDRKLIQDTLTQAGITFKIKDNEVQSVRGGSWKNTLVGIPYDQTGVAEAAGMYNDKELNEGLSPKIKKIIKAYKNLFSIISYNENGKKIMSGPKAHKEASRQLGVDPDDMEEYLRLEYYDFFDTVNKEWEKQKGNRKERYSNEIYGKVDADPTKSWWDLHQADAARRADRTKIKEAGRRQPRQPKFTLYPSYHAWRLELMRRGDDQIDHLDNDYVDNYSVLFAVDRNRRVVGMYYRTAETGTFVPPGQGFSDMIYYADTDPHWPYSDDDGKEDLR